MHIAGALEGADEPGTWTLSINGNRVRGTLATPQGSNASVRLHVRADAAAGVRQPSRARSIDAKEIATSEIVSCVTTSASAGPLSFSAISGTSPFGYSMSDYGILC